MAQAELEEERETGGGFGKFLFFATPILFTVVLLGVILILLDKDTQNKALQWLNQVPVVKSLVPDPVKNTAENDKDPSKQVKSSEATIKELKSQLAKKQEEIQKANTEAAQQMQEAKDLQSKLDDMTQQNEQKAQEATNAAAEDYQKEVKKLAQLYGNMNAGKAAAIMSNLTTQENVLLFKSMSNESMVAILQKMDPKVAADISIRLKDTQTSEDLAIAALQSRLSKDSSGAKNSQTSGSTASLDNTQLSQTFATMPADKAADLLLQTNKISPDKTLNILHAVDDATRSKILAAMSDKAPEESAKILNKLIKSK